MDEGAGIPTVWTRIRAASDRPAARTTVLDQARTVIDRLLGSQTTLSPTRMGRSRSGSAAEIDRRPGFPHLARGSGGKDRKIRLASTLAPLRIRAGLPRLSRQDRRLLLPAVG
jgi:hypothetical protein